MPTALRKSLEMKKSPSNRNSKAVFLIKSTLCICISGTILFGYFMLRKPVVQEIAQVKRLDGQAGRVDQAVESASASQKVRLQAALAEPNVEESLGASDHLALQRWGEIRNIPGAAELADDIAEYLQNEGADDFSFAELEASADETGMVEVGEHTLDAVIKDEKIRAKFQKLMEMVHSHAGVKPSP